MADSGINIIGGFEPTTSDPLDIYTTVSTLTDRNNIPDNVRYKGRQCFVDSEDKTYTLIGGIANSNWQSVVTGSATWGSITGLIENQTDLWAELTGYQQSAFDASDFYDVSGTAAYFDDTLGAVFPEGVDSSLLIKYTTPYRWGLANLLAQISWQHGEPTPDFIDQTSNFTSQPPFIESGGWSVDSSGGLLSCSFTESGTWVEGYRPDQCRVTITCASPMPGAKFSFVDADFNIIGGNVPADYPSGTHDYYFDLTFTTADFFSDYF